MKLTRSARPSLGSLVYQFEDAMHRYDAGRTLPILHAAKLTTPQLAALEFTREPRTVSAVAIYLGLSKPATSQLIDKLVRSHLVLRTQSRVDRRERIVILGTKGKTLVARIAAARGARFDASLAVLPRAVAIRFELILAEIVDILAKSEPRDSIRSATRSSRSRIR
jgi:DNA-binding MarR family transcriptional regulator